MLCCTYDPTVDLDRVMAQYRSLGIDVPLILIGEADAEPEPLMQALRSGARDLTERNDPVHLQLAVARELGDLEERRALAETRDRLAHCELRVRDLVEASTEPFAFVQQGVHVLANPAYRHLFGFAPDDDIEGTPVLDLVSPEHQGATKAFLRSQESDHGDARLSQLPLTWMHSDGSRFEAELHAAQAAIDGEPCLRLTLKTRPEPTHAPMARDVDPDTELPSRTALLKEISERLAAGPGASLALLYIGMLDLGHIALHDGLCAAYAAAAELARTLSGLAPEDGYLARVGDSGFAILVDIAGPQEARSIADDLSQRVRLALGAEARNASARFTIGLSVAGPEISSAGTLLDTAYGDAHRRPPPAHAPVAGPESANLRVQTPPDPGAAPGAPAAHPGHPLAGSLRPSAAKPEAPPAKAPASRPGVARDTAEGEVERRMGALLDQALGAGPAELRLLYQPIVSLMGDSQENYSVLVRLLDADGVLHEAKEFIGVAGARGRLADIDRWVISHAVAELANQRANGHRCNFFVNIGEVSLQDDALLVWICDRLRDLQVRGSWLTFQFPEEDACRNRPALARLVEGLKKIKCRIALARCGHIDDSRALMQQLQVDFLLFAHDFARGLEEDKVKQADLVAFASLGHEHKVQSIVTGVEDPRALTVLWTAGVDFVQGNFLQAPTATIERKG